VAKIKLSKNELSRQRTLLQLYRKMLPSLDLKRRQLSVELDKARDVARRTRLAVTELERKIGSELSMLASDEVPVNALVSMKDFSLDEENVVGVRLPRLQQIECEIAPYSRFAMPAWVDVLMERLQDAAEQRIRVQVAEERVRLLERAVRRTTQRVNLFERVLVPEAQVAIKRIMIYMGDVERAAVVNSKLAKAKIRRQQAKVAGEGQ